MNPIEQTTYLTDDVDEDLQWLSIRNNANTWYKRWAFGQSNEHTDSQHFGDILVTSEYATFPDASAIRDDSQLDQMLDWYRQRADTRPVIIYYLSQNCAGNEFDQLNAKLLARGASPNWKPYWMWCDLRQPIGRNSAVSTAAAEVDIRVVDENQSTDAEGQTLNCVIAAHPQQVYRIAAFRDEDVLGTCVLNVTAGEDGIGGVFNLEVLPEHQRQGIGTSLAIWMRELAIHRGLRYLYLNATPEAKGLYRKAGFESIGEGDGWSWHLPVSFAETSRPTEAVVDFLEALMLGDISRLDEFASQGSVSRAEMESKSTNGLTPLELAVHCNQPKSARWLIDSQNIVPDVVSLWGLGWKVEAEELIKQRPEVVNRKVGQSGATALHFSVQRDELVLVRLLLACPKIDLGIMDDLFESTAAEWAEHLGRMEVLELLRRH